MYSVYVLIITQRIFSEYMFSIYLFGIIIALFFLWKSHDFIQFQPLPTFFQKFNEPKFFGK